MPNTLIFGTSYIGDEDRLWLVRQWCHVTTLLNPDCRVVAIHTPGDIPFPRHPKVQLFEFWDNIGHLDDPSMQGRDGWGRAFHIGMSLAPLNNCDRVVHIECDLLLMRSVTHILNNLRSRVAAPQAYPHAVRETALMFFRGVNGFWVDTLREAYDWQSMQPSRRQPTPELPEQRMERIIGPDMSTLILNGMRCEGEGYVESDKAAGLDWLTHATRGHYEVLMRSHGIEPV